ncbi:hypothetical protein [uncultured Ilumatobacter sp.]|uniref:hypothetical protein n=1 Tax=uncultured Ilumatobacter sp. TaxID=879968 RepID=UPI00374EF22C
MTNTCVRSGTDGATSPGLAGTSMLLGGFALFALAWGPSICRSYEARSIPGSNWIPASPSGARQEQLDCLASEFLGVLRWSTHPGLLP